VSRQDDLREFDAKLEAWIRRHPFWSWILAFGVAVVLCGVAVGLLELLKFLGRFS
jgi:hypothetical protein